MGDRPSSGAGWDGGGEKERERGTVGGKRKDGTMNEIGCWDSEGFWEGIRVSG